MPSKIFELAQVTRALGERFEGDTFKNLALDSVFIDGGVLGDTATTTADIIKDNVSIRFAVTTPISSNDIFFFNEESAKFENKNILPYIQDLFIPMDLAGFGIATGNTNTYLSSANTFVTIDYSHLSGTPSIPLELTDFLDDGDANTFLKTDGANGFSFSTIDYELLQNKPSLPASLEDFGIANGATNTYLRADETYAAVDYSHLSNKPTLVSSYNDLTDQPEIPQILTDLGIADGVADSYLRANSDGTFSFTTITPVVEYADVLNTPSIPGDLFDLGVENNVQANTFLKTDGLGTFFFANLQYADIQGVPFIPSLVTDLGIQAATFSNQVLTSNGSSYEFANLEYSMIEGVPSIPAVLTDINITDGEAGAVLTANNDGSFEFKKINFTDIEDTPEDNSFINAIIFS